MALVNCPDCGKGVSGQASTCPDCGHPFWKDALQQTDASPKGCAWLVIYVIPALMALFVLIVFGFIYLIIRGK
jgi:uncharacterized OB-fold protein